MERTEHKKILQDLLKTINPENQATATELMTKLSDDYEEVMTNSENFESKNKELLERNEKLREVNADLFLKVGKRIDAPENKEDENEGGEEIPTFDELFNEKGELK